MQPFLDRCSNDDIISATLRFEHLPDSLFINFRKSNFDKSALQKQLYQIAQSYKVNFLDGKILMRVAIIRPGSPMDGCGERKNC